MRSLVDNVRVFALGQCLSLSQSLSRRLLGTLLTRRTMHWREHEAKYSVPNIRSILRDKSKASSDSTSAYTITRRIFLGNYFQPFVRLMPWAAPTDMTTIERCRLTSRLVAVRSLCSQMSPIRKNLFLVIPQSLISTASSSRVSTKFPMDKCHP